MRRGTGVLVVVFLAALASWPARRVEGTVDMELAARKLGFPAANCLYCHASPHAAGVMKDKAKSLGVSEGNCVACHGRDIPATLNDRGNWLVFEKRKRGAKASDMAWLKDYREPTPAPAAAGSKGKP